MSCVLLLLVLPLSRLWAQGVCPRLTVPVQAIQVMDDDGGRPAEITPGEAGQWIDEANNVFAESGSWFDFDPRTDFTTLKSTLLNTMYDSEDVNWVEEISFGNEVAARFPGKLVVLFCHGPGCLRGRCRQVVSSSLAETQAKY